MLTEVSETRGTVCDSSFFVLPVVLEKKRDLSRENHIYISIYILIKIAEESFPSSLYKCYIYIYISRNRNLYSSLRDKIFLLPSNYLIIHTFSSRQFFVFLAS